MVYSFVHLKKVASLQTRFFFEGVISDQRSDARPGSYECSQVCRSRNASRFLVSNSRLVCVECGLYHAVFHETRKEHLKRSLSKLVKKFSGSLLLQVSVAIHTEDVVGADDAKALVEESKFCLWVLTQLDPVLLRSWFVMNYRDPTATPSVMLPSVTAAWPRAGPR